VASIDDICGHAEKAWAEGADWLIMCDLGGSGMPGRWEQLWARRVGADEFVICSIPFVAYGLALGDRVTAASVPDGFEWVIGSVREPSGNAVLRVAFRGDAEPWETQERHEELVEHVERLGLPYAAQGQDFVAISCPDGSAEYEELTKVLQAFTVLEWSAFESAAARR
jgi:hypothetical protein